jgi:hypothetical protein
VRTVLGVKSKEVIAFAPQFRTVNPVHALTSRDVSKLWLQLSDVIAAQVLTLSDVIALVLQSTEPRRVLLLKSSDVMEFWLHCKPSKERAVLTSRAVNKLF